ncbi:MAG: hypothetical protein M1339_00380 [Bacteroidetes bacterium]|nr:hypothetical protein [Bacteroidota bacterium]
MLTEYIDSAMTLAHYEILEDDKSYHGRIPDVPKANTSRDSSAFLEGIERKNEA